MVFCTNNKFDLPLSINEQNNEPIATRFQFNQAAAFLVQGSFHLQYLFPFGFFRSVNRLDKKPGPFLYHCFDRLCDGFYN